VVSAPPYGYHFAEHARKHDKARVLT